MLETGNTLFSVYEPVFAEPLPYIYSRGGRHLRLPLRIGLRPQGPCRVGMLLNCGVGEDS